MSEKQFKLSSETVLQYQIMDNDTDLNESEVVDLLNKLYEENEQLQKQLEQTDLALHRSHLQVKKLKDENGQLKNYFKKRAECSNFQINKLKEEIAELQEDNVDTIVELSKENEQLKKKLESLQKVLHLVECVSDE